MKSIWLYRGIPESKRVWSGDPNGKTVKAPDEERYYDLIELADDDNGQMFSQPRSHSL